MRTEPTDERERIAIRADLDPELAKAVREAALQDGRTIAGFLRHLLTKQLDEARRDD